MRNTILFLFLFGLSAIAFAQEPTKKVSYFKSDWKPTKNKENAAYYRESFVRNDTLYVSDFYIEGGIQMTGQFLDSKATIETGPFVYFDKKGNKTEEGHYENGNRTGLWVTYFGSGQILEQGNYIKDKREGVWSHYYENGKTMEEWTYEKDKIVKVKALKADGTELTVNDTFTFAEQMPEYQGGHEAMMRFLAKTLEYPARCRENNIQGRVILQFIVNKNGYLCEIEALKSPDEDLTNEAIRVVSLMPDWLPGKQHGEPVAVRFTLPIVFKLN